MNSIRAMNLQKASAQHVRNIFNPLLGTCDEEIIQFNVYQFDLFIGDIKMRIVFDPQCTYEEFSEQSKIRIFAINDIIIDTDGYGVVCFENSDDNENLVDKRVNTIQIHREREYST